MKIVQAIICLHNWLRIKDIDHNEYIPSNLIDQDNSYSFISDTLSSDITDEGALRNITQCGFNLGSRKAMMIRDTFCHYFNSEGAVPWQFEHC